MNGAVKVSQREKHTIACETAAEKDNKEQRWSMHVM
jgi:hypothetical protein